MTTELDLENLRKLVDGPGWCLECGDEVQHDENGECPRCGEETVPPISRGTLRRLVDSYVELLPESGTEGSFREEAGEEPATHVHENEHGHAVEVESIRWSWGQRLLAYVIDQASQLLPDPPGYSCIECDAYGHGWMCKDEVWAVIAKDWPLPPDTEGFFLCLECAQKHLGRLFTYDDFTHVPLNYPLFFGYKMRSDEAEDEDVAFENNKDVLSTYLWSFLLEMFAAQKRRWVLSEFVRDTVQQGPEAEILVSLAKTALTTTREMLEDKLYTWQKALDSVLSPKDIPDEPAE